MPPSLSRSDVSVEAGHEAFPLRREGSLINALPYFHDIIVLIGCQFTPVSGLPSGSSAMDPPSLTHGTVDGGQDEDCLILHLETIIIGLNFLKKKNVPVTMVSPSCSPRQRCLVTTHWS